MITLKVTPEAADLIIGTLRQLPHHQVHDLVMDLFVQARAQREDTQTLDLFDQPQREDTHPLDDPQDTEAQDLE